MLIQKKNIKFGKKKTIKLNRLNIEAANLTDYSTSQIRQGVDSIYDPDNSNISNLLCTQNTSVSSVDK